VRQVRQIERRQEPQPLEAQQVVQHVAAKVDARWRLAELKDRNGHRAGLAYATAVDALGGAVARNHARSVGRDFLDSQIEGCRGHDLERQAQPAEGTPRKRGCSGAAGFVASAVSLLVIGTVIGTVITILLAATATAAAAAAAVVIGIQGIGGVGSPGSGARGLENERPGLVVVLVLGLVILEESRRHTHPHGVAARHRVPLSTDLHRREYRAVVKIEEDRLQ